MFNPFADKLVDDDRRYFLSLEYSDYQISFYAPHRLFYSQMGLILSSCITCCIIYYGIVCKNKPNQSSTQGLLLGFGFIIPFAISIPFQVINIFDIRNKCMRMGLVTIPITMCLTCLEAMFGFTKPGTSKSMSDYILAEAFIVGPALKNGEHIKVDNNRCWRAMRIHIFWLFALSLIDSWLGPVDYEPFHASQPATEILVSFEPGQWYNTFLQALASNLLMLFGFCGAAAFISQMTGRQYKEFGSLNPMFCSKSPSDFWGRRWNIIVHDRLKQGVYKPVRWNTKNNKTLAYLATFIISGIMHELVWKVVFFRTNEENTEGDSCMTCYDIPSFGKQILFFGWNGILLILETYLGDRFVFVKRFLPHYVICHFVILLSLPIGHLVTGELVKVGYLRQMALGLFRIKVTKI